MLTPSVAAHENVDVLLALVVGAAVPVVVGALVLRWHLRQPIGWLLVVHGALFFVILAFDEPGTSRAGLIVDQLTMGSWVLLFLCLVLIAFLLPDGRTANRLWRWWVRIGLIGVLAFVVGAAGDGQGFADTHGGAGLPVPWLPEPVSGLLGVVGLLLVVLLFFGSFFAVWRRLRRATGDERLQLLWLVWGALTVPVTLLIGWVNHFLLDDGPLFPAALGLVAVGLPVAVGIAILKHRLFDIRLVLSRTLTYLLLVVAVVAVYALLLFATDRLIGNSTVGGLLAVGVVAVAVHPAYSLLRGRIERWVYGLRSDPRAAIRLLADRAEAADPNGLIAAVTDAVAAALKVDRVRVEMSGPAQDSALRAHMVHRGEPVGYLAIEVPPGREFSQSDLDLVQDLARYTAILVRSEQLNDELRESRSRIVAGREEERRRLRRDLHDGVGPSLAAIVLKLNATQSRTDADERNSLIAETRNEVKAAVFEDDDSVFAAMRAGARGYLLKDAEQDEIERAIRAAAAGGAIFGPEIAQRVIAHFASGSGSTGAAFPSLTEREREVLEMVAAGKGNATIAHELMISLKTVRNHVSNIFTKLQVSDRSQAIVKAREAGLGGA